MPKRIVYTRRDGGVSVCAPSLTALRFMTGGGGRWDGEPRGFLDRQIAKQAEECGERSARTFVMAMQFGGCTDAEAYAVMRDRFCAHMGSGCELWGTSELSADRWFRDAWRRSHNGGPIYIDVKAARGLHFSRVKRRVAAINKARADDISAIYEIEVDWPRFADSVRRSDDCEEIRRMWPAELAGVGDI